MVICLERGADLHMAQLMSLSLASVKSPEEGPLNGCVLITGKKIAMKSLEEIAI